jgi:chromosome segregation ATPase
MTKQIERQVRDLQKEMAEAQRERDLLRLRPCRGDMEIREKDEGLERLDKRIESIQSLIRELGKKRREVMSAAVKGGEYESPFS